MIIRPRKRTVSAPVAPKQPEPQRIVEKKPEKKEEIKKVSSRKNEVKQSFIFDDDIVIKEEKIVIPEEE